MGMRSANTGGRDGLAPRIGLFPLTNIVVANMIGAGIFTTSGLLMRDLGDPLVMLGLWAFGGLIALCGALAYGELGAAIPRAGGEYAFLSELYHPLLGFLSADGRPSSSASRRPSPPRPSAFPNISRGLSPGFPAPEAGFVRKALACLVILLFTAIHARGIELGARVQNVLTVAKVILIVGLIAGGLASGNGHWSHFAEGGGFRFDFAGLKSAGLALMWIMFAYSGWNASAYIGSEVREPAKTLPRSLILGTGIVILLYAGLNVLYLYAVSPAEMSGVISVAGLAAGKLFSPSFETVLSLLISFALFSSLSAFIILGPRVYYSMARDGYFFRSVARIHPVLGAPSRSVALQGLIAMIIVVSGSFDQILTYMGFSLGIFPLFAVLGVFKLRTEGNVRHPDAGLSRRPGDLSHRGDGHPRPRLPPEPRAFGGGASDDGRRRSGLLLFPEKG